MNKSDAFASELCDINKVRVHLAACIVLGASDLLSYDRAGSSQRDKRKKNKSVQAVKISTLITEKESRLWYRVL
jgi:hypothetical protein